MRNRPLYKICRAGLFAAIICVCSFIAVPIGTVPVTAALLCVMLSGIVLSPFESFAACIVYIIMGAVGLPIFSGGSGGIGVLFGPTGGYIWSYPLCALIVSLVSRISVKNKFLSFGFNIFACFLGVGLTYFLGTVQYMLLCKADFYTAAVVCIIPFIPVDIVKSVAAVLMGLPLRNKLKHF